MYRVENDGYGNVLRIALGLFMVPVAVFDFLLGRGLGMADVYARGLDRVIRSVLQQNIIKRLKAIGSPPAAAKDEEKPESVEFFLLLQHYVLENCEHHRPKMDNYVALYGFLRTITFLLIMLAWLALIHVFLVGSPKYLPYGTPMYFALGAFLFYMAYMKFWRRYSLEVLMAVSVAPQPSTST